MSCNVTMSVSFLSESLAWKNLLRGAHAGFQFNFCQTRVITTIVIKKTCKTESDPFFSSLDALLRLDRETSNILNEYGIGLEILSFGDAEYALK